MSTEKRQHLRPRSVGDPHCDPRYVRLAKVPTRTVQHHHKELVSVHLTGQDNYYVHWNLTLRASAAERQTSTAAMRATAMSATFRTKSKHDTHHAHHCRNAPGTRL